MEYTIGKYNVEVFTRKGKDDDDYTGVEVTTSKTGKWIAEIGCWFINGVLEDYDGVFYLPSYVIKALRKAGWTVPKTFMEQAQDVEG